MSEPLHVAFLGCGFITRVHSQYLKRSLSDTIVPSYASRDRGKADEFRRQFRGRMAFGSYEDALADRSVDAVVVLGTEAKLDPREGKRFEVWETDEPSERGIEGMERMRLVRDDIKARVQALYSELAGK